MTKKTKILAFSIVALAIAFLAACSSDGPMLIITPNGNVYSEEEYNELVENGQVDEAGNVIVEESNAKSSSSKKAGSSSSTKGSSSSGKATSGSSDGDDESSSSGKATSSSSAKDGSSSSGKATSSSSAKDGSSSSGKATSSSSAKDCSSSSGKATSSSSAKDGSSSSAKASSSSSTPTSSATPASSSAEPGKETIANEDDGEFSFGTDDMKEISESAQSELDSLKEILDNGGTVEGFEKTEGEFNEETLPYEAFDENDFFCFTGEGEWLQITRELLGQYIPHYKNGAAWGNLRHFDVKFMDACAAVYIRRK